MKINFPEIRIEFIIQTQEEFIKFAKIVSEMEQSDIKKDIDEKENQFYNMCKQTQRQFNNLMK